MLKISNLSIKYIKAYHSIYNISFDAFSGDRVLLIGEQDSGNDVVLRCIAQLDSHYEGEISLDGAPMTRVSKTSSSVCYLPPCPVFLRRSIMYNLAYPLLIRGVRRQDAYDTVSRVAAVYGLDVSTGLRALSTAQRYLFAAIRAIIRPANIVLIDLKNILPNAQIAAIINDIPAEIIIISARAEWASILAHSKTVEFYLGAIKK